MTQSVEEFLAENKFNGVQKDKINREEVQMRLAEIKAVSQYQSINLIIETWCKPFH